MRREVASLLLLAAQRYSTLALTMNVYVKMVRESQTNALDSLAEVCNASATETIQ